MADLILYERKSSSMSHDHGPYARPALRYVSRLQSSKAGKRLLTEKQFVEPICLQSKYRSANLGYKFSLNRFSCCRRTSTLSTRLELWKWRFFDGVRPEVPSHADLSYEAKSLAVAGVWGGGPNSEAVTVQFDCQLRRVV
jgi:hypothetical protein